MTDRLTEISYLALDIRSFLGLSEPDTTDLAEYLYDAGWHWVDER